MVTIQDQHTLLISVYPTYSKPLYGEKSQVVTQGRDGTTAQSCIGLVAKP